MWKLLRVLVLAAVSCLLAILAAGVGPRNNDANIKQSNNGANNEGDVDILIEIAGDPIDVWSSVDTWHKCGILDVPDIPTRAWTAAATSGSNSSTSVHMIQGSTNYHIMQGDSLFQVQRECQVAWNMTGNSDPSRFAANEFLDSPVKFAANKTVVALSHTEFPGNRYGNCPHGVSYPHCWTVTLGLMVSNDNGQSWDHARPPPHHLVAAVPYAYNASQVAYGWGDPTNIMYNPQDTFYYFMAWNRNQVGDQSPGMCLMRTQHLLDPSSWRGWNGNSFDVTFVSPYNTDLDPKDHICQVLDVELLDPTKCNAFGLVYMPEWKIFVMTFACLDGYGPIYYAVSTDLLHWSPPKKFYDKSMLPDAVKTRVVSMHYPNLMDAAAPTKLGDVNYGMIGTTPHLFWVSFGHGVHSDGRHAWATPLLLKRQSKGLYSNQAMSTSE